MLKRKKIIYFTLGAIASSLFTIAMMAKAQSTDSTLPMPQTKIQSQQLSLSQNLTPAFKSENILSANNDASLSDVQTNQISNYEPVTRCQVIHWIPNRIYTITGSLDFGTHITFPENAVDVIVGNKGLWTEEHRLNHVFIEPNTDKPEGAASNMTYIGDSNSSYEFILKRVPNDEVIPCVIVERDGGLINNSSWNTYQQHDQNMVHLITQQFDQEKSEIIKQQQNALDKYRGMIYTGYTKQNNAGWFGNDFVSDVYDDGRWTYIRINNDEKAVMSIYGVIDGKKDVLQYSYDETTKLYRVSGIYQQLILVYGKNQIIINRNNN